MRPVSEARSRVPSPTSVAAILSAIACLALPACSDDDRGEIKSAVAALRVAVDRHDAAGVCEALSSSARRDVGRAAHKQTTCRANVGMFLGAIAETGGGPVRAPTVTDVQVDGDRATVVARSSDGGSREIPLVAEDGWKVDALAGRARVDDRWPALGDVPGRPVGARLPGASGGDPCADVDARDPRALVGGCELELDAPFELSVLTLAGRFHFLNCFGQLGARVGPRGELWIDELVVIGEDTGCSDVNPCGAQSSRTLRRPPWRGVIRAHGRDGVLRATVSACLSTCIGEFAGRMTFDLDEDGRRWRPVARESSLGAALTGTWRASESSTATGVRLSEARG
jgi:hypothetical protein